MRRKILIIDDSEIFVAWLRAQLEAVGYDVVVAKTAGEAGTLAAIARPAAIILDIVMPEAQCGDVLEQIRLRDPHQMIPVVFYSGQPVRRLHEAAARYGASGYAAKKRDISELLAVVERCITGGQIHAAELVSPRPSLASNTSASNASASKTSAACLFVDDDTSVLRSYQRWFSNKIDADYVSSPVDALGRLHAARPPRFVIADIVMPGMSGLDLYARAVCIDDNWRDRFLFVTGNDSWRRDPTQHMMRVPVLPKPVSIEKLHAIIDSKMTD